MVGPVPVTEAVPVATSMDTLWNNIKQGISEFEQVAAHEFNQLRQENHQLRITIKTLSNDDNHQQPNNTVNLHQQQLIERDAKIAELQERIEKQDSISDANIKMIGELRADNHGLKKANRDLKMQLGFEQTASRRESGGRQQ